MFFGTKFPGRRYLSFNLSTRLYDFWSKEVIMDQLDKKVGFYDKNHYFDKLINVSLTISNFLIFEMAFNNIQSGQMGE